MADINVDAILGYPWLRDQKIGVFPHMRALAEVISGDRVEWLWGCDRVKPQPRRPKEKYAPRRR